MKEEYEDRLQRAKNKLHQEKARRRDERMQDDASHCSEVSKTSKVSYSTELSRATAKQGDSKGPRSEWRNKARAVIERGRAYKEEADVFRDDASMNNKNTSSSFKEREAQIDCLVERNARLNERERQLKIESHLLDAVEAAAKAEGEENDESYYLVSKESQESQKTYGSSRSTKSHAKRVNKDTEIEGLSRSFQEAKNVWQVRCMNEKPSTNEPTPLKSNPSFQNKQASSTIRQSENRSMTRSLSLQMSSSSGSEESHTWSKNTIEAPESPESVKSYQSTKNAPESPESVQSYRSTKKAPKSPESVQSYRSTKKAPQSPESVKSYRSTKKAPQSPESVKSYRSSKKAPQSPESVKSYRSNRKAPESPESVKSYRSTKSSRSVKSMSTKSEQAFGGRSPAVRSNKYGVSLSPEPASAKSEQIPRKVASKASRRNETTETPVPELNLELGSETKLSYRQSGSSDSVSSHYNKRSQYSYHHASDTGPEEALENMFPEELAFPVLSDDSDENGENQPPVIHPETRKLSYREKSAMLASMENASVENIPNESGTDDDRPPERKMFRQRGQAVKQNNLVNFLAQGSQALNTSNKNVAQGVLGEKSNNVNNTDRSLQDTTKRLENLQLSSLVNENKELKERLEKERTRRSQLDDKTTHLRLEVHQKGQEISELRRRKDVSASHKEKIYKMEDALQEANRHLVVVMDENVQLREDLQEERARRARTENQAKNLQAKLKKKSDEVVVLAKELKRKEDKFNDALMEERHMREVAESQLARACLHINKTEKRQNEEMDELEKENSALRHAVQNLENFLKQKMPPAHQNSNSNRNKARRQSGGSQQEAGIIASKPTWTTAISEITTDFEEFEDNLNSSQMGEI